MVFRAEGPVATDEFVSCYIQIIKLFFGASLHPLK